ncbi:MAG: hypothetical protein ACKVVT_14605 [Dehalococcoidia bacterium]
MPWPIRPVPPDPHVTYTRYRPASWAQILIGAAIAGLSLGTLVTAFWSGSVAGGNEYRLWRWQTDTLLDNVFSRIGIGPDPDTEAADRAVRNYFRLTTQIRNESDKDAPDLKLLETLAAERALFENDVERYVEGRIHETVEAAGLTRSLPLFTSARIVWPPVDFELTTPPRLLVRSPREKIERAGDTLLKPGIDLAEIERLEEKSSNDDTATLVVAIGGLAAYPAMVTADRSYGSLVDTASHEWVHHYLAFYPLGEQWGKGGDAETLNETTANIAGREIAALILRAHPIELSSGEDGRRSQVRPVTVDFNKEMRALRLEVDRLLAAGQVDQAEALMEEKRRFLEDGGIFIRKINQAYFAFYGTYADGAASSNPVGPKIERVWELTKDVGRFLAVMREVTNVRDLDDALNLLESGAVGRGVIPTSP